MLLHIQEKINKKIEELHLIASGNTGVIIVHSIPVSGRIYVGKGAKVSGYYLEVLQAMGMEYYSRYFNEEDAADYIPK